MYAMIITQSKHVPDQSVLVRTYSFEVLRLRQPSIGMSVADSYHRKVLHVGYL